ncbi:hypothetical protein FJT64_020202 [Amphibalanus amphitrite]|uniref:Uncharacterized protein n=2 Tax=Amphibalanus amphitrite TaxID=1232801 RepID=A0A6A4WRD0_AMPAM|nr:hypothetical protein FJT64_020202 [Amphibalanus amphitrite]
MSGDVRVDDGRVFRRHFNHIRRDGARETDRSCAEVPSDLTHRVPREPKGPVIVPRPVSSAAAESPARAQPAATPAQEVATDTAPTDTETAEADAATEEQTRDAEEQTRDAEEQPAQATAGARRDSVELPPQAPLRRSSRPRAPVQRMNLYIN